jgi:Transposase, Mutator family
MVLNIRRDRNSEFDPQPIPKGSRMSDKLEEPIIGMYSRGMTIFNSTISYSQGPGLCFVQKILV